MQILDYWAILKRRRWVVMLAVATVSVVALIGSYLVTPLYRSTATLLIERHTPDVLNFRDLAKVDYSWAAYNDFYQTQYKIIGSNEVARLAADRRTLTSHPAFDTASRPGLIARLRAYLPSAGGGAQPSPLDVAAARVLAGLEVEPVRNSQLVKISWVSDDPDLAAEVANAVADAYILNNMKSQYSTSEQAQEFLVEQIAQLKNEISGIERRLQEYGEIKNILSIDDSNNVTLKALKDVAEERTRAQTELAKAEARYRSVLEAEPDALADVLNSALIARLRQEYAGYEAEYSEKSKRFKEGWPGMESLTSKLDQARSRLEIEIAGIADQVRANAETDYLRARGTVSRFDDLLESQQREAQTLKRDAVEYAYLQSEVFEKRETLNALLQRQNEMALSTRLRSVEAQNPSNLRVMERARPAAAPFRPNTRLNLVLGLLLGLTLGVGTALALDYLDNTITSVAELKQVLSIPVLATIPARRDVAGAPGRRRRGVAEIPTFDLIAHLESRAGASEAYRELRTSILLSHAGKPPRQIMITSTMPEEGKTATAVNLAVVLSQLGRRVLLVDTDLRRPRIHKVFGVDNGKGVSTLLSGLEPAARPLIVPSGIENLALLPSGPIPPNPSELLNSEIFSKMGHALLDQGFDHVLFDSPPVLSVSDPLLIANAVEGGVLVVRAGRTPRQSVRLAAEKLSQAAAGPFGVVLNGIDPDGNEAARYEYYGDYGENGTPEPELAERTPRRASGSSA